MHEDVFNVFSVLTSHSLIQSRHDGALALEHRYVFGNANSTPYLLYWREDGGAYSPTTPWRQDDYI